MVFLLHTLIQLKLSRLFISVLVVSIENKGKFVSNFEAFTISILDFKFGTSIRLFFLFLKEILLFLIITGAFRKNSGSFWTFVSVRERLATRIIVLLCWLVDGVLLFCIISGTNWILFEFLRLNLAIIEVLGVQNLNRVDNIYFQFFVLVQRLELYKKYSITRVSFDL